MSKSFSVRPSDVIGIIDRRIAWDFDRVHHLRLVAWETYKAKALTGALGSEESQRDTPQELNLEELGVDDISQLQKKLARANRAELDNQALRGISLSELTELG